MRTVGTFEQARELSVGSVGLVPTMGYLHEGHLSLIEAARASSDTVVVSVFVNPLQFDQAQDLDAYPRSTDRDADLARSAGADVLFLPDDAAMFSTPPRTTVDVSCVSEAMEGVHRPGHFVGVATVVGKLFAGLQPDAAFFGRKDAQQLAVVTTLVSDLSFPIAVVGLPIVRESDGLALSSRNVRIPDRDRRSAAALSRAIFAAADRFEEGERSARELVATARNSLDHDMTEGVEYIQVANGDDAGIVEDVTVASFLAIAARIGGVRLIDNVFLDPDTGGADRGVLLGKPSILYGGG